MAFTRSPLHVLMTADATGEVWTYALTLMDALRPAGVTFTLAVMGPAPSPAQRAEVDAMDHVRLRTHPYRLEWMPDADRDVHTAGRWLQRLSARIAPDIVHINGYAHAALAPSLGRPVVSVAHGCLRSRWRAVRGEAVPDTWNAYTRRVQAGLAAATRIIAPTQAMAAALRQEYAFNGPIDVIAHGMPPMPPTLGKAPKESCIFAGGRGCDDAANLAVIDEIAASLPWPVIAAGPVDEACADHPPRHVWHLGPIDRAELRHRLARAAVYVHPARYEPFGLGVLEAAHAGCALVLGDIPALREVWGDAALYVRPEDRAGLRRTLLQVIANGTLRAQLSAAARTRAHAYGEWQMADRYLSLYETLRAQRIAGDRHVVVVQRTEVATCGL